MPRNQAYSERLAMESKCTTWPQACTPVSVRPAAAVVRAVAAFDPDLAVLGLPGSALLHYASDAGLRAVGEAFADRAYAADGTLVPRSVPGSVIHDPDTVSARVIELATQGTVMSVDGQRLTVSAESVCVHGDTPGAVDIARAVRRGLENAGVRVGPFVQSAA